ncbi:HyaD/HybD family hydrogenase maturation endopeptidase [Candidatus Poribacteria bacterium]|nr:HyaD/HybD family hydrogenase maturation endopeptidase [Candidatus Poribacteria bacterium]
MRRIAVVGVGNILMGDEGIGVKVVEELRKERLPEGVELFDGGTAFHVLVDDLIDFDKLIIVDAVLGGEPPGTIYRFEFGELEEMISEITLSLHDVGVMEALMLERLTHRIPEEIVFIGIEPERIELSMELSSIMREKLPELVERVLDEIKRDRPLTASTSV